MPIVKRASLRGGPSRSFGGGTRTGALFSERVENSCKPDPVLAETLRTRKPERAKWILRTAAASSNSKDLLKDVQRRKPSPDGTEYV